MPFNPDELHAMEAARYLTTKQSTTYYFVKFEGHRKKEVVKSTQIDNYDSPEWVVIRNAIYAIRNQRDSWFYFYGDSSQVPPPLKNDVKYYFNESIIILYHDNKNYCIIYSLCNILLLKNNIKNQIIKHNNSGYCNFNTLQRIITQLNYG